MGYNGIITGLNKYDFNSETKRYVYDSIYFEEVYGIFYQYDDLENSWVDNKRDEELASNVKRELLEAVKNWIRKIDPIINE